MTLGNISSKSLRHKPALAPATTIAPSVGSPTIRHDWPLLSSFVSSSIASLQRTPPCKRSDKPGSSRGFTTWPFNENLPAGVYPSPDTLKCFPFIQPSVTVISFWVRVPVLSEQITVAHPRVSTAGSFRIKAFRRIIFCIPRARQMVTTAGKPSGTAAMARLTAIIKSLIISPFSWLK